jgi:hypothetical protein
MMQDEQKSRTESRINLASDEDGRARRPFQDDGLASAGNRKR